MKRPIMVAASVALVATSVYAQETTTTVPTAPSDSQPLPIPQPVTANAVLRAGTPISLTMAEEITTKKKAAKVGQRFQLEVSAPIEVNGVVVIPAGTPAWGELVSVRNKGMWGKSGKLEAKLLYARVNGRQIRLTGTFDDKGVTGTAAVVGAIAVIPIAGFFTTGTSAVLPMGGPVKGFIDEDVELAIAQSTPVPMQISAPAPPMPIPADAALPVEMAPDSEE
ncbi:hypothetical protein [Parasphingorhabdus sp.]|uniref:hypothetical protein n=1 Tax=Parasphingorhabdus sp. TaxID=2709688 RepID=UPI003264D75C